MVNGFLLGKFVIFLLYFNMKHIDGRMSVIIFNTIKKLFISVVLILACSTSFVYASDSNSNSKNNELSAHIVMSHSAGFIGNWLAENKTRRLPATQVQKVEKDKPFNKLIESGQTP